MKKKNQVFLKNWWGNISGERSSSITPGTRSNETNQKHE
jgi:hypothetical protein